MLNSSLDKTKARTVVGKGEKGPLCDPGSELLLGGKTRVVGGKWDEESKNVRCSTYDEAIFLVVCFIPCAPVVLST